MATPCVPQLDFGFQAGTTVRFDGGALSSDAGLLLLREFDERLGLTADLTGAFEDRRRADRIEHPALALLRQRVYQIVAGYEDADDCDLLRTDPVLQTVVGQRDLTVPLGSQPTMSRLENTPSKIELARMMRAMIDLFCASYARPPASIVLDIDDTLDRVHGRQQLSLFNAYYDERCFLPIHIYTATWRPTSSRGASGSSSPSTLTGGTARGTGAAPSTTAPRSAARRTATAGSSSTRRRGPS